MIINGNNYSNPVVYFYLALRVTKIPDKICMYSVLDSHRPFAVCSSYQAGWYNCLPSPYSGSPTPTRPTGPSCQLLTVRQISSYLACWGYTIHRSVLSLLKIMQDSSQLTVPIHSWGFSIQVVSRLAFCHTEVRSHHTIVKPHAVCQISSIAGVTLVPW